MNYSTKVVAKIRGGSKRLKTVIFVADRQKAKSNFRDGFNGMIDFNLLLVVIIDKLE